MVNDCTENKHFPENLDLFFDMVENARDGINITQNGDFKYVNKAFCDMLGYTREELCCTVASDLLAPSDNERKKALHFWKTQGVGEYGTDYATLLHKNGSEITIEFSVSPITYQGANASFITIRDITERKQMQEKLEQSESKYRNLVENAHDGIIITQFGKFKFVNNAFCNMVEFTQEELIEDSFLKVVADEDKERMKEYHKLRMSGEKHQMIYEAKGITKSGKVKYFEINTSFIDYNGHPATFIILRDHTEHRALEDTLKASERKYRRLFEAESDAIFLVEKETGQILDANPAATKIYGYSHDEFLTMLNTNVSAEPEKTRQSTENESAFVPVRYHKKKDGTVFAVEISAGITELENKKVHIITARDITERIRMQNELTQSESKYRTLIEKSLDGIVISQDAKVILVNQAFADMLGYTVEECLEKFGPHSIIPEDQERVWNIHNQRMAGELNDLRYSAILFNKNGERIATEFNSTTIEINGKPASFITARDITSQIRMQKALEESERKYRELADLLPQTVYELDLQGNVTYVNKTGRKTFGLSDDELGFNSASVLIPEDRERMRENIRKAINEKRKEGGTEYTALRRDGSTFPTIVYSNAMFENGELQGMRGLMIDISERKAMEEALRKSEQKFRELSDLLPQTIFELDRGGNVTYLNKAGRIAFGLSENEIGFPATSGIIPDDHKRLMDNIRKAFVEKGRDGGMEYTAIRPDGKTFPIVIYSSPMIENYETKGIRGLIVDISERKAMEEALRKSEQHYRQVIQSLQEGLFVLQDEKFIFVNDAIVNILGYTVEEMYGKHFNTVVPPECRDEAIRRNLGRREGNDESWSYEFLLLHKDGQTRIPVILSTNLTELDGKVAVVGTAKDITDRIAAEEEIKAAHKRLEEINQDLELTIRERTKELTKANTQLLKLQKENLQSQFDVLKQQVNPHFLFNSLNVLTSLIRLEPELAEKFTEHLAKVYRYVLENKDNELVALSTEMSFLDAYIFLINIRFMDKVVVNINISEEKKNTRVIPLAMQLLIENAIKHNSMSKKSPLVINIFIDDDNYLNVVNNLQEREAHMISTGVGLKNIQNRYRLINNTIPVFEKTATHFRALIPLIFES